MAKRNKAKRQRSSIGHKQIAAKRSVSPTLPTQLHITGSIMPKGGGDVIIETKMVDIQLPITLSQLAWEIAHIAFALAEELAFKAKVNFLPDKELKIEEENIPY